MTTAKEVTSQIWEMANRLRGNMDASEYRNYILGFMFYRYLSERQEKYLFDNKIIEMDFVLYRNCLQINFTIFIS